MCSTWLFIEFNKFTSWKWRLNDLELKYYRPVFVCICILWCPPKHNFMNNLVFQTCRKGCSTTGCKGCSFWMHCLFEQVSSYWISTWCKPISLCSSFSHICFYIWWIFTINAGCKQCLQGRLPKGQFRWYNFCLQLPYATSVVCAARVKQIS